MSRRLSISSLLLLTSLSPLSQAHELLEHLVIAHADLAYLSYLETHRASLALQERVDVLIEQPSEANLLAARQAWTAAKDIYSQTEAFRFGHPVIDAWEPQVNAWPLDEGFIDYVEPDLYFYELGNPYGQINLVSHPDLQLGPEGISVAEFSPQLLASLNELGGSEANVATGWHAIEFLLWGQDLHGNAAGTGERPASDFAAGSACTHGHCERRAQYLAAVTQLLVDDLAEMTAEWQAEDGDNYRATFLALPQMEQLRRILYGVGSLSLGELAGERMRVALFANSSEDEQDCFSDHTHGTLYYNFQGVRNILYGRFAAGESEFQGASLMGWLHTEHADLANRLDAALNNAQSKLQALYDQGENGQRFDQLIAPGNREGSRMINEAIQSLVASTAVVVDTGAVLGLASFAPDSAGHF